MRIRSSALMCQNHLINRNWIIPFMAALFRIRSHPELSVHRNSSLGRPPLLPLAANTSTKLPTEHTIELHNPQPKLRPILKVSTMRLRASKPKPSTLEKYSWNPETKHRKPLMPAQPSITSLELPHERNQKTACRDRVLKRRKQRDLKDKNVSLLAKTGTENALVFNQSEIRSKEDVLKTFSSTPSLRPIQFFKQLVLPMQGKKRIIENNDSVCIEHLLDELQRRQ